jgi:lipopolysaccharide transport system ATP-binding protein
LLKILSRITKPTHGRAEVYGRIGCLLEVGTGFHPELTGRENIYLNGTILGMKRAEIDRKFDEIVAFAEIEQFLDTPVKRYSSGMYVRLAFAVAAHLEPEILVIDEVLAVGDGAFQKKCLRKMGEMTTGGRTILFVSHQLNAIRRLCERSIWLDSGQTKMIGSTAEVVSAYEASFSVTSVDINNQFQSNDMTRFLSWRFLNLAHEEPNMISTLGAVTLEVTFQVAKPIRNGVHGIALWNNENQLMWGWSTENLKIESGTHTFIYNLLGLPLRPGAYRWQVSLFDEGKMLDMWYCLPEMIIATEPLTHPRDEWSGILNIPCNFQIASATVK